MAKNKKKQSSHQVNKLVAAQHKNEFFSKLNQFAKHLGDEKIFLKIPASELVKIYDRHVRGIKIIFDDSVSQEAKKHTSIIKIINLILKEAKIKITEDGYTVNISEYYSYPITMFLYARKLDENAYPHAKELINLFKPFIEDEKIQVSILQNINSIIFSAGIVFNNFTERVYSIKLDSISDPSNYNKASACLKIYTATPEKINVNINNNVRPAYRVLWGSVNGTFDKCILNPTDFEITNSFSNLNLDVYIQTHALNRLKERLDNLPESILHFGLYDSIKRKKICKDIHGNFLLEYNLFTYKFGYLRIDLVEGLVVIRTFLFITNNDTPEGERLNKDLGVEKLDKEYLLIDKLSTFSSEKIINNEKIKEIFTKAGCGSLFNYTTQFKDLIKSKDMSPETMLKYLEQMKPEQETSDFSLIEELEEKEEISENLEVRSLK